MATITIRNIDDDVRDTLKIIAAEAGRSMEADLRQTLIEKARLTQLRKDRPKTGLDWVHELRANFTKEDMEAFAQLEVPPREPIRDPRVDFSDPAYDPA